MYTFKKHHATVALHARETIQHNAYTQHNNDTTSTASSSKPLVTTQPSVSTTIPLPPRQTDFLLLAKRRTAKQCNDSDTDNERTVTVRVRWHFRSSFVVPLSFVVRSSFVVRRSSFVVPLSFVVRRSFVRRRSFAVVRSFVVAHHLPRRCRLQTRVPRLWVCVRSIATSLSPTLDDCQLKLPTEAAVSSSPHLRKLSDFVDVNEGMRRSGEKPVE